MIRKILKVHIGDKYLTVYVNKEEQDEYKMENMYIKKDI